MRRDEWDKRGPSGCLDGCLDMFVAAAFVVLAAVATGVAALSGWLA